MKDAFGKFKALYQAGDYDEALSEIANIEEQQPLPPNILVLKGMCIQMGSGSSSYDLADAEAAYKEALEIDSQYVDANVEAGFYYLNLMDEADKALPYFEKALTVARSEITETIRGLAECLCEIKSPQEALEFVEEAVKSAVDEDEIRKTVENIRKLI